jgi:CRISPR/Cas system-associated protein Cas10 (large subunit of type III CRISPR-Cas system)
MYADRKWLTNEEILKAVEQLGSMRAAARMFGVGDHLIRRAVSGQRRQREMRRCTLCRVREVWRDGGCRMLCRYCYQYGDRGSVANYNLTGVKI